MKTTKRQENAQSRRSDILEHSLAIFANHGFHGADVQVIADRAKVGKGTVYRHFGNKEKLFLATARWCLEQVGEFVEEKLGGDQAIQEIATSHGVAELLRQIAAACAEFYQSQPNTVEMMIMERAEFRESVHPSHLLYRAETRANLDALAASAVQSGEFRSVDPVATIDAFADLLFGNIVNGCIGGAHSMLRDRVAQSIEIFLSGLVSPGDR